MRSSLHNQLTGSSTQMRDLREEITRIARSDAKVLITGESGVGKEVVACSIHSQSARSRQPFVAMNCAGLPETLLESELFGHVKGSFTGAFRDKAGKLQMADGGTVFLDEIGEMTLRMQGLLLRFLETGELQKVGADRTDIRVNVRVVAATNRDLGDLIARGLFREDLFYRLNVVHLVVPPLRQRREDIPELVTTLLERLALETGTPVRAVDPDAMRALADFDWPGNVRQLQNALERQLVVARHEMLRLEDLPPQIVKPRVPPGPAPPATAPRTAEALYTRLRHHRESFWTTVYPLYMRREITRATVRDLVARGLVEARGSYKILLQLFNMAPSDYKKFLNFLRKHDCQLSFKEYREVEGWRDAAVQ